MRINKVIEDLESIIAKNSKGMIDTKTKKLIIELEDYIKHTLWENRVIDIPKWKYFEEALFIYHGDWNDPELKYNGKLYNYYDIENAMTENFRDYAEDNNIEWSEEGFTYYFKHNQEYIKELFENTKEVLV